MLLLDLEEVERYQELLEVDDEGEEEDEDDDDEGQKKRSLHAWMR